MKRKMYNTVQHSRVAGGTSSVGLGSVAKLLSDVEILYLYCDERRDIR